MNQELPGFDPASNRFVSRRPPHEPIGILHLTDLKTFSHLALPHLPDGRSVQVPIHFLNWVSGGRS